MKKYANLLPKDAQKEIRYERLRAQFLNMALWILLSLIALGVSMFATKIYLKSEANSVDNLIVFQKEVVTQEENLALKKELDSFNSHLSNLIHLEESHAFWSEVLIEFARITPADIAIDALTADRENHKMTVVGFAKTRDSVLLFRSNLLDSDFFKDVNFPLSNLIRPTDVSFRYTFYVDQDELLTERFSSSNSNLEFPASIEEVLEEQN